MSSTYLLIAAAAAAYFILANKKKEKGGYGGDEGDDIKSPKGAKIPSDAPPIPVLKPNNPTSIPLRALDVMRPVVWQREQGAKGDVGFLPQVFADQSALLSDSFSSDYLALAKYLSTRGYPQAVGGR